MNKYETIQEYFDDNLPKHFKVTKDLVKDLRTFRISWGQKSEEYMEFLGGNTLGIQAIRFSSRDEEELFEDVLDIDIDKLKANIKYVKGIDPKWNVTGNPVYLTLVYLMHLYDNSNLPTKTIMEANKELYLIFAYKVIGSLLHHYFKFQTTEAIAKATYEKLSNRYLIKQFDNWQEVFEFRSLDVQPPEGLHYERIKKLDTDGIIRVVSDLQGRIRELVKNIYAVMIEIIEHNDKIKSTTMVETNIEDTDGIKSITTRPDKYIIYLRNIINLPDFVNDDLVYLVCKFLPTADEGNLKKTLEYISNNVTIKAGTKTDIIGVCVINTINYIQTKGIFSEYQNHMSQIIKYTRGYWSSSSVKDKGVKEIKKYLHDIVIKALNKKTHWVISSTLIAVLVYIFVRGVYKHN